MQTLSKTSENHLLAAVRDVVDRIDNQGEDPTAAVVKVASDRHLPRGHIQLLCSAYNTGRVNAQRKSAASSILDRFDDIPLADHEAAVQQIWPDQVETPAEQRAKTAISADYMQAPSWLTRSVATQPTQKVASAEPAPTPRQVKDAAWKAIIDGQHQLEYSRTKSSADRNAMVASLQTLTNYFKQAEHIPFETVHYAAAAQLGDLGDALLQVVAAQLGRQKQAAAAPRIMPAVVWTAAPYCLAKAALASCEQAIESRRSLLDLESRIKSAREEVFGPTGAAKSGTSKLAAGGALFGSALGSALVPSFPKHKTPGEQIESHVTALDDPDHSNAMRNIQVSAMLRDMMANDEVIKGYEPEEVLSAYNEVAQTAPTVAMHSVAIRPLIRRQLQHNWESHETSSLIDMEKGLRRLKPVMSGPKEKSEVAK